MKRWLPEFALLVVALGCAGIAGAQDPRIPEDFEATYEFYRNGKLAGEASFSLQTTNGQWVMRSSSRGTKGLARMAGLREQSTSRGRWHDGKPRPDAFEQNIKYRFGGDYNRADFDWSNGQVKSVHEDGETLLDLEPGTLDAVSTGLAIRTGLLQGEQEWFFPVVDKDRIDRDHFKARAPEQLDFGQGCFEVSTVEKIRRPESTRYTRTHHARELDFVPVFVEHGKQDGDHMETRIVSLKLDGQPVSAKKGCG